MPAPAFPGARTRSLFRAYAAALAVFAAVDTLWLGVIARPFFAAELEGLVRGEVRLVPAALFYLGYPVGMVALAVAPALHAAAPRRALAGAAARGGLLGLMAYGAYDLTNMATLTAWPVSVAAVDMAWGTGLTALASAAGARAALTRRPGTPVNSKKDDTA